MTDRFACKICILTRGLKGSELDQLPKTDEELYDHLERVHGYIVVREGETREQAEQRVQNRAIAERGGK
jgi:hypothetical protein